MKTRRWIIGLALPLVALMITFMVRPCDAIAGGSIYSYDNYDGSIPKLVDYKERLDRGSLLNYGAVKIRVAPNYDLSRYELEERSLLDDDEMEYRPFRFHHEKFHREYYNDRHEPNDFYEDAIALLAGEDESEAPNTPQTEAQPKAAEQTRGESTNPLRAKAAKAAKSPVDAKQAATTSTKYDLQYKFKPGETVRSRVLHQAAVKTTIDGTSQTARTVSASIKQWKINGVDDQGRITFVTSVEHVKMANEVTGREKVHYDSLTDKSPPAGFEQVAKRVGVPLTIVTMNDRGQILKREEQIKNEPTAGSQLTLPLPEHPIAVGESWTTPSDIRVKLRDGNFKKIQARQKYTLSKVSDGLATISVERQLLTPVNSPEIEVQLAETESTGTIRFNIAAGRVVSQQLDLDRNVIGFPNDKSEMHYLTRLTEELLAGKDSGEKPIAAKPGDKKKTEKQAEKQGESTKK